MALGSSASVGTSVALLTFGPHWRPASQPNIRYESYTSFRTLAAFLMAPTFARNFAAKGSKMPEPEQ